MSTDDNPSRPGAAAHHAAGAAEPTDLADLAEVIVRTARELTLRGYQDPEAVALTSSTATVMRYIDHHPGTTPTGAAHGTGLRRSNLSAALRELEKLGFVERRVDPQDRRAVRLFPTARAAQNLAAVRREWSRRVQGVLGSASAPSAEDSADVGATVALLRRLADGLAASRPPEQDPR